MKVYLPEAAERPRKHVIVQPRGSTEWLDADGKPRTFAVLFKYGCAEVDNELGRYLLDQGVVRASPIILLNDVHVPAIN